ncbi:hypothetical protein BDW67DRAFT_154449 [Aspergillus spinulosporus]
MPEPRDPLLKVLTDLYSGSDCIIFSHEFQWSRRRGPVGGSVHMTAGIATNTEGAVVIAKLSHGLVVVPSIFVIARRRADHQEYWAP